MINPDEIPLWFAIPASVVLCLVWRRLVVVERRVTDQSEREH